MFLLALLDFQLLVYEAVIIVNHFMDLHVEHFTVQL
jgi:hypothetical protein